MATIFSPFGVYFVKLVEFLQHIDEVYIHTEIRPVFFPHADTQLKERLRSLLVSEAREDDGDEIMSREPALFQQVQSALIELRAKLEAMEPDDYAGDAYDQLSQFGLLPSIGTGGLLSGVARCTPHAPISNRTRWTLQVLLVRYWIKYGAPKLDDAFLYTWHDVAFQFAGGSRTIGKLAWWTMRHTTDVFSVENASRLGCSAIYFTNQPDGTIPITGVPTRMLIDGSSKLFFEWMPYPWSRHKR